MMNTCSRFRVVVNIVANFLHPQNQGASLQCFRVKGKPLVDKLPCQERVCVANSVKGLWDLLCIYIYTRIYVYTCVYIYICRCIYIYTCTLGWAW